MDAATRQDDILRAIHHGTMPSCVGERLSASREGTAPWTSTMTPAELLIARSHGIRPVAAVSATCWMHYGYLLGAGGRDGSPWAKCHARGWETALVRLRDEAKVAGANAVVDVKMRTIPVDVENSMDFSLVGTAVKIDGLPPSSDPVVATVPALAFVKLLDADVVPTGIAVGASTEWMNDWRRSTNNLVWVGNTETQALSDLWERVRRQAHAQLRQSAQQQGNGVLAHVNFSQMFEYERDKQPKQYLARHIVIATTVDSPNISSLAVRQSRKQVDCQMVIDLHAGKTPLQRTIQHHQSYTLNTQEEAI